jgi:hypothetical protein
MITIFGTRVLSAECACFVEQISNPSENATRMSVAILCSKTAGNPGGETSVLIRDTGMGDPSIWSFRLAIRCSINAWKLRVNAKGEYALVVEIEADGTKSQTASTAAWFRLTLEADRLLVLT